MSDPEASKLHRAIAHLVNLVQAILARVEGSATRLVHGVQLQNEATRRQDRITRRLVVLMIGHGLILAGWVGVSWWRSVMCR